MENTDCTNCILLSEHCKKLQEEIKLLSEKVDLLTDYIFHDTAEKSTQYDITTQDNSENLNKSKVLAVQNVATQCEFVQGNHAIQSEKSLNDNFENLVLNVPDNISTVNNANPNDSDTDTLLKIFLDATSSSPPKNNTIIPFHVQPFCVYTENKFIHFDVSQLDSITDFDLKLNSRHLAYYGEVGYQYNGIVHKAKSFNENSYLCQILGHLKSIMPNLAFNSALITKYRNGNDHLNFHSDNEPEIIANSDIITLSFGESRVIEFRPITHENQTSQTTCLQINHGEIFLMSRESQNYFEHSVPKDSSKGLRLSITLRNIDSRQNLIPKNNVVYHDPSPRTPTAQVTENSLDNCAVQTPILANSEQQSTKPKTLYISSSMFSGLSASKLSSASQDAVVFFYRGATVAQILEKLKQDPKFFNINPVSVTKIFILCGTNNVDKILDIPFANCSKFVSMDAVQHNSNVMNQTYSSLNNIHKFLRGWSTNATINFINILPRISKSRNYVINWLNKFIYSLCSRSTNTNFVNTEKDRNLFTRNSYRQDLYFSSVGADNVHLNNEGVIRLAKHIKFLAHN